MARIIDAVENFHQPEGGYRFSEDSLILASFARAAGAGKVADLGAGCGVVGLAALEKGRLSRAGQLFFVEREPLFWPPLEKNLTLYQPRTLTQLIAVKGDWRDLSPDSFGGPLDYILANPPYFLAGAGRPSSNPAIDAARREIYGRLADLIETLARLLTPGGQAALMLPAFRQAELLSTLERSGFEVERHELVGQTPGGEARLILAQARRG